MSGVIKQRRKISQGCELVYTEDNDLHSYLIGLGGPTFHSDTANALWALAVTLTDSATSGGGSAYLVSDQTMRRIVARRYP